MPAAEAPRGADTRRADTRPMALTRACGTGMRPWRRHININRRLYD